jgi:2'-5' RNA ligase
MKLCVGLEVPLPVRIAMGERAERLRRCLLHASWVASANDHCRLAVVGESNEGAGDQVIETLPMQELQ